jgi:beta-N-acetylhexosaminidase
MNTLEQQIGQLMFVGFEGKTAPSHILRWLERGQIGGIILFARNVESAEQVARLTAALRDAAPGPILIAIDQEGGTVARLRDGFTESPGAMALSAAADAETQVERMSFVLGSEMRAIGINWNYAPMVDLAHDPRNPSVGTRSFGTDARWVGRLGLAAVRGFQAAGVAACAKHFPGLGNTPVDTHLDLAVISGPLDYLYDHDLEPFRALAAGGADSIMITHVKFEALDRHNPATMSEAVVHGLLRQHLHFDGVAVTDCMEMQAITRYFDSGEAAVKAVTAGIDIVLNSHTVEAQEAAYTALLDAAGTGRLSEERLQSALRRIGALKQRYDAIPAPTLDVIRSDEHLQRADAAARAGCTLVQADAAVLPLPVAAHTVLVEFSPSVNSLAMDLDPTQVSALAGALQQKRPLLEVYFLPSGGASAEAAEQVRAAVSQADVLVLATRNAHLSPDQLLLAQQLLASSARSILLCLRNPYDAAYLQAQGAVLCTCGDSTPSLHAAAAALAGEFVPTGHLPVALENQVHP